MTKGIRIFRLEDPGFARYGRILEDFDFSGLHEYMLEFSSIPDEGNNYIASVPEMESKDVCHRLKDVVYGGMDIQIGYCNGNNSFLNGLEYHKGSEVNYAVTDLVLQLGRSEDIKNDLYDSKNVEAFLVPAGTAIELYQNTLHFAPCKMSDAGFKCVVILPRGTNTPLDRKTESRDRESRFLFLKNKWLLAHVDNRVLLEKGAFPGIVGKNHKIEF